MWRSLLLVLRCGEVVQYAQWVCQLVQHLLDTYVLQTNAVLKLLPP